MAAWLAEGCCQSEVTRGGFGKGKVREGYGKDGGINWYEDEGKGWLVGMKRGKFILCLHDRVCYGSSAALLFCQFLTAQAERPCSVIHLPFNAWPRMNVQADGADSRLRSRRKMYASRRL